MQKILLISLGIVKDWQHKFRPVFYFYSDIFPYHFYIIAMFLISLFSHFIMKQIFLQFYFSFFGIYLQRLDLKVGGFIRGTHHRGAVITNSAIRKAIYMNSEEKEE